MSRAAALRDLVFACNLIIHPALKTFCVCVNKLFIDFDKSFMVLQKIMDFSIRCSITLKEPKALMFCFCTWSCPDQTFSWVCINLKWKYQSDRLVFVCLSQSLPRLSEDMETSPPFDGICALKTRLFNLSNPESQWKFVHRKFLHGADEGKVFYWRLLRWHLELRAQHKDLI